MNFHNHALKLAINAKQAFNNTTNLTTKNKNTTLKKIADLIEINRQKIKKENQKDIKKGIKNNLNSTLIDRLTLSDSVISSIINSIKQIQNLPDPIGTISNLKYRPSGIQVGKIRAPLGVIFMIYESRPNVTIDAAALCLKSGNTVILRGGKEAINSNKILIKLIHQALKATGVNKNAVQLVENLDRDIIKELISTNDLINVVIPRGSKELIESINKITKIPIIKHLHGNCHVYVDENAEIKKAITIADNSKTHRLGVCNAAESLLVHQNIAKEFLPKIAEIYQQKNIEMRVCLKSKKIMQNFKTKTVSEEDYYTEYLNAIISIKIVDNLNEAINHINKYGSQHTDVIVTTNINSAKHFMEKVDSSSVIINSSSRFADGFEYGLGAEIGISTDKLHVRGPVGIEGLTTQKYVVIGDGHIRN